MVFVKEVSFKLRLMAYSVLGSELELHSLSEFYILITFFLLLGVN